MQVTDYAGNTRRADTLALYAPDSSLEADDSNPIRVKESAGGGRWVHTQIPRVTLLYSRHFINKVISGNIIMESNMLMIAYRIKIFRVISHWYIDDLLFQVFEDYKLLAPVIRAEAIDPKYSDKIGNITTEGLGPTEGIKGISYTVKQVPLNKKRKKRQTSSTISLTQASLMDKEVMYAI